MGRNRYDALSWSKDDIESEAWKASLGGGAETWESRGRFQVELLSHFGLQSDHMFADFGCGPLRAGQFIIEYLKSGRYHGYDFNTDFLSIGRKLISDTPALSDKIPQLFSTVDQTLLASNYDFILAFSVLNHFRSKEDRRVFLQRLQMMKAGGRAFITHARWMAEEKMFHGLDLEQRMLTRKDLPEELNLMNWGWKRSDEVFPILELRR